MREEEQRIYTGSTWEQDVGYCRALRVGDLVFVSGTTAVDADGRVVAAGDPGAQTEFILHKIGRALEQCGAGLQHVVRTRMFVTDITQLQAVAGVHRNAFENVHPTATCVEVARLVDPRLVVEIEVDALVR